MIVTKVGGANMIAHAQWPQYPSFPRVAVFYVHRHKHNNGKLSSGFPTKRVSNPSPQLQRLA